MHRRNSDSYLYCKVRDGEEPKERSSKLDRSAKDQARYVDQQKLAFVQEYLEKADDARSMTTETSDSGIPGTHGQPSELGMEETGGKLNASLYTYTRLSVLSVIYEKHTTLVFAVKVMPCTVHNS